MPQRRDALWRRAACRKSDAFSLLFARTRHARMPPPSFFVLPARHTVIADKILT
jgi:hypothetical protein